MRKVTYCVAVSLDGYIAGPGGSLDWLRWSDDAAAISGDGWKGVDAILMGRKTYEFAAKSGGGGGGPSSIGSYIFSRTMTEAPDGAELVSEDAAGFVAALKRKPGGGIMLLGGGELASFLVEAGLVDEIGMNVHPVLLGAGTPIFAPVTKTVELEFVEARAIAKGCVMLRYGPAGK